MVPGLGPARVEASLVSSMVLLQGSAVVDFFFRAKVTGDGGAGGGAGRRVGVVRG